MAQSFKFQAFGKAEAFSINCAMLANGSAYTLGFINFVLHQCLQFD